MKPLTKEQLAELQRTLKQEQSSVENRLRANDNFGTEDSHSDMAGELAVYDNHPGDVGTALFERGKDIALNEHEEHHLSEIKDALDRIQEGTYGSCVICKQPIPFERLQAIPTTEYCFEHVPDRELSQRRPAEELILQPPFGRTSLDELPEQNQFDGEDAWQIVESWGNSDSPAMAEDNQVDDYNHMFIEADENEGYVEAIESFLATDLYGNEVTVVRNRQYHEYMDKNEGEPLLEPDRYESLDD